MTKLADLLHLETLSRGGDGASITYATVIDETFTIGPKVHGGSLQMVITRAARAALIDLAELDADPALIDGVTAIAVASDYLAAPDPAAIVVEVSIVKRGRTVSLARVEVTQNDRRMVTSTVTLGRLDEGAAAYRADGLLADMPVEPAVDGLSVGDSPVGEVMHLGAAADFVLDAGTFAVARGETGPPVIRGWCRPKDDDDQPDDIGLDFPVLVCDISPPVVMNLGMFGWAPTVQLTTYVRRLPAPGWLRYEASTVEVGRGMFAEDHLVVDSTGAVVAQSRQLALIPARR
ncbi:hypothetical protein nbrc107696_01010 [Gordonia spumicola]|uniref:Diacylglycerol kinase n=1 Tax=Gordonia spumicola TaxID=589161 RepID=A0A7I9V2L5_9ACTN|nr:thioesterase family protein [Gordonia spumicola]GED99654.1 hypothetical protein nbrc107696_01010 [Gordonia spumicola]